MIISIFTFFPYDSEKLYTAVYTSIHCLSKFLTFLSHFTPKSSCSNFLFSYSPFLFLLFPTHHFSLSSFSLFVLTPHLSLSLSSSFSSSLPRSISSSRFSLVLSPLYLSPFPVFCLSLPLFSLPLSIFRSLIYLFPFSLPCFPFPSPSIYLSLLLPFLFPSVPFPASWPPYSKSATFFFLMITFN